MAPGLLLPAPPASPYHHSVFSMLESCRCIQHHGNTGIFPLHTPVSGTMSSTVFSPGESGRLRLMEKQSVNFLPPTPPPPEEFFAVLMNHGRPAIDTIVSFPKQPCTPVTLQ